jgi:hypothetical protein
MFKHRSRTIEGINSNINALKAEVDDNTKILNTQLQFDAEFGVSYHGSKKTRVVVPNDYVFKRLGEKVNDLPDLTETDYIPKGGTPLLDAIGRTVEKIKEFHKDDLGDDNLKIIVTVFTDGEENSSFEYDKDAIKKMITHLQSDGKWTFTFVGCGSIEDVEATSGGLGISALNTCAYVATDSGFDDAYGKIATSYSNYARACKSGVTDDTLFTEKIAPKQTVDSK